MNKQLKCDFEEQYELIEDLDYALRLNYKAIAVYVFARMFVEAILAGIILYIAKASPDFPAYVVNSLFGVFMVCIIFIFFNIIKMGYYHIKAFTGVGISQNVIKQMKFTGSGCRNVPTFIEVGDDIYYVKDSPFRKYYFMQYKRRTHGAKEYRQDN